MPFTLTMPKLSPTMEAGTIVKWHKKEGDAVKDGDILFEVATDKATVEHNALDEGFLRKILIPEGKEARVNDPVAIFSESADEDIAGYQVEARASVEEKEESNGSEDKEKEQLVKEKVKAKPASGNMAAVTFSPELPLEEYEFPFSDSPSSPLLASPFAKKIAKEKGIDLHSVKGSGPNGRVMSRDLDLGQEDAIATFGQIPIPVEKPGSYLEETPTPMRKAIGEKLQASKTFIPHFYVQQDIDVDALVKARLQLKAHGIKVTFNDFILRACALALKQHAEINSGFDSDKGTIIRFQTIDIAVAVTIPDGLITPIIRHADYKNLGQISKEAKQLFMLAKEGKLQPNQYRGGSFTLSNLGMFGIDDFQAVINPPQAAILAIGGMRDCPVVKEKEVQIGKRMMLSLSSDHRVIDGADAARFLVTLKGLLEAPAILLI